MRGNSTNPPASSPCMANDIAAVHGFRLLKVPLDSNRLSSNIPALLVFTTDTGNSKLAPAILHDGAAVDGERLVRCLLLNDAVMEQVRPGGDCGEGRASSLVATRKSPRERSWFRSPTGRARRLWPAALRLG